MLNKNIPFGAQKKKKKQLIIAKSQNKNNARDKPDRKIAGFNK